MKSVILFGLLLLVTLSLFSCKEKDEWYKGGTLQNATADEWRQADEKNKLATCADFAANLKKANGETYTSMDSMKYDAYYYKAFLDEATKPPVTGNTKVAEIVAAQSIARRNKN